MKLLAIGTIAFDTIETPYDRRERAIGGSATYFANAASHFGPVGVVGEVYIAGAGLARGYLGRPGLTAERFVADPFAGDGGRLYRTGDRARYLADGNLEYAGRLDHQVKIRGFRIELGEIEHVLAGHDAVVECVVVAHTKPSGDSQLVAHVVFEPGAQATASELRDTLRAKLPDYMVPPGFVTQDELPLTPNGKLDRNALLKEEAAQHKHGREEYVEPRSSLEREIAGIWGQSLQLEKVSVDVNFFDLGGHSLLLAEVHSKLQNELGAESLSIIELFQYPTVESLATYLKEQFGLLVKQTQRWHVISTGTMSVTIHTAEGGLREDAALHGHLAFNLTINLLDAYKHYSYDTPLWIREGLGHFVEREISPEFNSFDSSEGAVADVSRKSDWDAEVKKLLAKDKAPRMAELVGLKSYAEFDLRHHFTTWSMVSYLVEARPEAFAATFIALARDLGLHAYYVRVERPQAEGGAVLAAGYGHDGRVVVFASNDVSRPAHKYLRVQTDTQAAAILHHNFPELMKSDAGFQPTELPVTEEYLQNEGLSPAFVQYMQNWKGFVKGTDGVVDTDLILNS